MARIGGLTRDGDAFIGQFRTLKVSLLIRLKPVGTKRSASAPDFVVQTKDDAGTVFEIGSAWWKTPNAGGERFLSLTLDDPSWREPLNLTAFPADADGAELDIVWTRPRADRRDAA